MISERRVEGLASARARVAVRIEKRHRGPVNRLLRARKGGRPVKMTPAKVQLAMAAMGQPETRVGRVCEEMGVIRQTLYRHVSPKGELRPDGKKFRLGCIPSELSPCLGEAPIGSQQTRSLGPLGSQERA